MPKITNIDLKVAGITYPCTIWYTTSDKFFIKGFPDNIQRAGDITPFGHKTEADLIAAYREGIKKYEEIIQAIKKVIVFKIRAAKSHIEDRWSDWRHSEKEPIPIGVDSAYSNGMGFLVEHEIRLLRTVGETKYLHDIQEDGSPSGWSDKIENKKMYKIIDWTQEREDAFKELHGRFDKMFMSFVAGFADEEKFIDSIPTLKLLT